jgi:hypothetical protein
VQAGRWAAEALKELFRLATSAESEIVRVAAIKEILDRGYGKPKQSLEYEANSTVQFIEIGGPPG